VTSVSLGATAGEGYAPLVTPTLANAQSDEEIRTPVVHSLVSLYIDNFVPGICTAHGLSIVKRQRQKHEDSSPSASAFWTGKHRQETLNGRCKNQDYPCSIAAGVRIRSNEKLQKEIIFPLAGGFRSWSIAYSSISERSIKTSWLVMLFCKRFFAARQ
jgi:hypothetical protein